MEKETIHINEPVGIKQLFMQINCSNDNEIVAETDIGKWKEQIVPTIYLRQNEYYRMDFNSASSGYHLKVISTEKNVSFSLEFLNSLFVDQYKPLDNKFSLLKCINRSEITRFEKKGSIQFMGVKAKNSYKIMKGLRGAPVGGLITGMIVRGAFKLAAKSEDDLVEKNGALFSLFFLENGEERKLDVIVESFYVEQFNEILKINWTSDTPPKPKEEENGGCFIATACYNDYDHPIVYQLRHFRDSFLRERKWGRKFISFYYKHSPRYAKIIESRTFLKYFFKYTMIKPLYYFSKILTPKK